MNTETGVEVGLRMGFHTMTELDMGRKCRARLDMCPACEFDGLEPGKTYCYKPSHGQPSLVTIGQTTPKRTQAVASVNQGAPRRVYRGDYHGKFIELDADLRVLAGITHATVVKAAVDAGLDVPPEVRREYPDLFITIPERFANGHTPAERTKQALTKTRFDGGPISVEKVDAWIEEAHKSITRLRCERTRVVALNPDTAPDYDQYMDGHRQDIDYYRWLRPLVDVGGVFHIEVDK